MKTVANDIIERVDYNTVVSHYSDPVSIVRYDTNPKYAYFKICTKDCDLAIPLLAKVVNKQLSLMNYHLSVGHVKAFCKTSSQCQAGSIYHYKLGKGARQNGQTATDVGGPTAE